MILYHLSKNFNLKELIPKIPDKLLVRKDAWEDITIKRSCFAETIDGCIIAMNLNNKDFLNNKLELAAYTPKTYQLNWLNNNQIIKKTLVFDAHITKEHWALEKLAVIKIGTILVDQDNPKAIQFKPLQIGNPKFLNPDGQLTTYLYKYKWKK